MRKFGSNKRKMIHYIQSNLLTPIKIYQQVSLEEHFTPREWDDIYKVLRKRQQRIPYQKNYPSEIKEILRHSRRSQINKI